jgi:hypothetical protein
VVEGAGTTLDCACEARLEGGANFARSGAGIVDARLEVCLEVAESSVDGGELGVREAQGGDGSGRVCIEGEQGEEGEGMVGAGCTERNGIT